MADIPFVLKVLMANVTRHCDPLLCHTRAKQPAFEQFFVDFQGVLQIWSG